MNTVNEFISFLRQSPGNSKALNVKNQKGVWQSLSTTDAINQISWIAAGLHAMGIKSGDKVAIMSPPIPEWTICDLGIMLLGAISVPIFNLISEEHFIYQIAQCETKAIFVSGRESHDLCHKHSAFFHSIISLEDFIHYKREHLYKEILEMGQLYMKEHPDFLQSLIHQPDDLASIIYTSGSYGLPKGVELTHKNIVHEMFHIKERLKWGSEDIYLHYLPLAHIFGRLMCLNLLFSRTSIYYVSDVKRVFDACREIKPTVFVLIPRMLEKIYNSIVNQIKAKRPLTKAIASWAFHLAHNKTQNLWDRLLSPLADVILYSKIRNLFGGSLRIALSGSAKSNPILLNFFAHAGIPIIEGYGMTEACPVISNSPNDIRIGYLGKALPEVEVKISDEGEILLRGPMVMRGYYRNPDLTRETIDADGWLHTSDLGSIDAKGFVKFEGRKTDICKSSYGEFINLPSIEEKLNQIFFVDTSLVIAENKPFVSCLLFVDSDVLAAIKKRMGLLDLSDEELLKTGHIKKEFDRELARINANLNPWERIRDYRFIYHKASIEGGEYSPAMKMRRSYILSKYQATIDAMYPEISLQLAV